MENVAFLDYLIVN